MSVKLFYLLEELKENYSQKILNEVLTFFQDEFTESDLLSNEVKSRALLNEQPKAFYEALAVEFVRDLDEFAQNYFLHWDTILYYFNHQTLNNFYEISLEIAHHSEAVDYINGIIELNNGKPEIALYHFNRIDNYMACYFIGLCYYELQNYENAIKNNLLFQESWNKLRDLIKESSNVDFSELSNYLITKWNVANDLGFLYNRIGDYKNAKLSYDNSLEIFSLEQNFEVNYNPELDVDAFTIFVNNYLLALEKLGDFSKCIEVLAFVNYKLPNNLFYIKQIEKFKEKKEKNAFADGIINQLFKSKKPFDLNSFQETKLISKEKSLEDMIVEQIKYGYRVFDKNLEIYQDGEIFGRQYYIQAVNGILDLLLIDKSNDILYVVELKRNEAGIEVVDQIEKYIEGLTGQLGREVRGIICLHKPDLNLKELVRNKSNIELYTYEFQFKSIE